jgi:hypothetical protein
MSLSQFYKLLMTRKFVLLMTLDSVISAKKLGRLLIGKNMRSKVKLRKSTLIELTESKKNRLIDWKQKIKKKKINDIYIYKL